ncbi:MAG TPA: phosphoribosyltransferase [Acidimicrobiia bacterium]|nr:phosphoribosyltransferase [Acidimicrobiia bacterium]
MAGPGSGLPFRDRREAGRVLASELLDQYPGDGDLVVLALPRGGVPVGFEVARALDVPLDVIVVRKLGVPSQPELAMGAVGEDGVRVLNHEVIRQMRISESALERVEVSERTELERRATAFRGGAPMLSLDGRTVVIVDDGLATGSTARAAIRVARAHGAQRVVLAVPVAPRETLDHLGAAADAVIAVASPHPFMAIGQWYDDFGQTTDDEVRQLLAAAREGRSPPADDAATRGGDPRS